MSKQFKTWSNIGLIEVKLEIQDFSWLLFTFFSGRLRRDKPEHAQFRITTKNRWLSLGMNLKMKLEQTRKLEKAVFE